MDAAGALVSLRCRDVPLGRALESLAQRLGFELELDPRLRGELRSVDTEHAPVQQVLAALLAGVPYQARFEPDPGGAGHWLRALAVGAAAEPGRFAQDEVKDAARPPLVARRAQTPAPLRRHESRSPELEEYAEQQGRQLELLSSDDAVIREEAAGEIDPEGDGLAALIRLVYEDPDPLVRIAAVGQLEDSDTHASVQALTDALRDSDRRVVLEAIDALEFAGDETTIPYLEPFLDSPDVEIRRAAEDAIEFLE